LRLLLRIFWGALSSATSFAVIALALTLFGGTECDRAACNSLGEFADAHSTVVLVVAAAVSVSVGVVVATAPRRGRTH